jgi:hypothetical protein
MDDAAVVIASAEAIRLSTSLRIVGTRIPSPVFVEGKADESIPSKGTIA